MAEPDGVQRGVFASEAYVGAIVVAPLAGVQELYRRWRRSRNRTGGV